MTGAELADELSGIGDAYCSDARVAWQLARFVNANMAAILAALRSERPEVDGTRAEVEREIVAWLRAKADDHINSTMIIEGWWRALRTCAIAIESGEHRAALAAAQEG